MVNEQVNIQIKAEANDALGKIKNVRTTLGNLQSMAQSKPIKLISASALPKLQQYKKELSNTARETGRNARVADSAQRSFERLAYKMQKAGQLDSSKIDRYRRSMTQLQSQFAKGEMSTQKFRLELDKLKTDMRLEQQFERAGRSADTFAKKLSLKGVDTSVINNFKSKVAESQAAFMKGKVSVDKFKNSIKEYKAEARQASKQQTAFNTSLSKIGRTITMAMGKMYAIISVVRRLGRFLGSLVGTALEFEQAFLNVSRRLEATNEEMDVLEDKLRTLAKNSRLTVQELTKIAEEAARLGLGAEGVYEFTDAMEDFLLIADATAEEATTQFGQLLAVTGRGVEDLKGLTETVVRLGSEYATSEEEIISFTQRMAAVGDASGITAEEIMAIGASLTELGVKSERGGTAIMKTLIEMEAIVRDGGEELQKLEQITGMTMEEMEKAVSDKNTIELWKGLANQMGSATEQGENLIPVFRDLFGTRTRMLSSIIGLSGNYEALNEAMELVNDTAGNTEYMQGKVEEQNESSSAAVEKFKSKWDDLKATIGDSGTFADVINLFSNLVEQTEYGIIYFDEFIEKLKNTGQKLKRSGKEFRLIKKFDRAQLVLQKWIERLEDINNKYGEGSKEADEYAERISKYIRHYSNFSKELRNTAEDGDVLRAMLVQMSGELVALEEAGADNTEAFKHLSAEFYKTMIRLGEVTDKSELTAQELKDIEFAGERLNDIMKELEGGTNTFGKILGGFNNLLGKFNINLSKGKSLIGDWVNKFKEITGAIQGKVIRGARDSLFMGGELSDMLAQDIAEDNFVADTVEQLDLAEEQLRYQKNQISGTLDDLYERLWTKEEDVDDPMGLVAVREAIAEKQKELSKVEASLEKYEDNTAGATEGTQTFTEKVVEAKKELDDFDAEQQDMIRMVKDLVKYESMTIDEAVRTYKTLNGQLELNREQREENQEALEEERETFADTIEENVDDIEDYRDSIEEAYEGLDEFNKDITSDIRNIGWEIRDVTKDIEELKKESIADINDIQDELDLEITELEEGGQEDIAELYLEKQEEIKEKEEEYNEVVEDKEKNLEDSVKVLEEQKKLEEELADLKKNIDEDVLERVTAEDELSEREKIENAIAEQKKELKEEAKERVQKIKEEKKAQLEEYKEEIEILKEQREIADAIRSGRMVSIEATDDDIIGYFKDINEEGVAVTKDIQYQENKIYAQKQANARDAVYDQIEEFENGYEDILSELQTNIEDRKTAEKGYTEFVEEERDIRKQKIDEYNQALQKLTKYGGASELVQDLGRDKSIEPIPEVQQVATRPKDRPVSINVGEVNEQVGLESFVRQVESRIK